MPYRQPFVRYSRKTRVPGFVLIETITLLATTIVIATSVIVWYNTLITQNVRNDRFLHVVHIVHNEMARRLITKNISFNTHESEGVRISLAVVPDLHNVQLRWLEVQGYDTVYPECKAHVSGLLRL